MLPCLKALNKEGGGLGKGIALIANPMAELEGATHLASIIDWNRLVVAEGGSPGSRIGHGAGQRAGALGELRLDRAGWRGHLAWTGACS